MHFEILVEDQSGKRMLDILIPKIVDDGHSFIVHSYKGVGRIPRDMRDTQNASKRILLENLPKLLKGHGKTQAGRPYYKEVVVVLCDLDNKCLKAFLQELHAILNACRPAPKAHFCIAIEEGEAWFLGDLPAVRAAYPNADRSVLSSYQNDSICGTWEMLADAVYAGGSSALSANGWQSVGAEKSKWAEAITPHMVVEHNLSPSFCYFRNRMQELSSE